MGVCGSVGVGGGGCECVGLSRGEYTPQQSKSMPLNPIHTQQPSLLPSPTPSIPLTSNPSCFTLLLSLFLSFSGFYSTKSFIYPISPGFQMIPLLKKEKLKSLKKIRIQSSCASSVPSRFKPVNYNIYNCHFMA